MDQNKNIFLEIKDKNNDNEYTLKSRLLRFYNCHCPDKIETIDNIVKKYTSKEKELFKSLVAKYGKEPDISNHEKLVIEERLRLQREMNENKRKKLKKEMLEKNNKKKDYFDIYTYPYNQETLTLLEKIDSCKGKEIPREILSQI